LQGEVGEAARELILAVAEEKNIAVAECQTVVDHVHLLVAAHDRTHLAKVMNLLKGASSRRLLQRFPELKMDAGVNNLWQHRYAAKVAPEGALASIGQYIRSQMNRLDKYER
jgi:putative transposase